MAGIGSSLREARMRQRLDITEAEADTKIRGKYLRALENEEWALLPGPTFVKSFLRTYADYLGLDGRTLVDEFKLKYERPEMQAIAPPRPRERSRQVRGGPPGGARLWLALSLAAVVLIGLFVLGQIGGGGSGKPSKATPSAPTRTQRTTTRTTAPAPRKTATLRIIPTGQVYVCLRDAAGRRLLDGVILQPGAATKTYRSSRLRLTLGNGDVRLVVNGRSRGVAAVRQGVGYAITPTAFTRLSGTQRPSCT